MGVGVGVGVGFEAVGLELNWFCCEFCAWAGVEGTEEVMSTSLEISITGGKFLS